MPDGLRLTATGEILIAHVRQRALGRMGAVNTPPPEGGGFRLRLEAGSIGPLGRLTYTTVK
jgi:hypothetical protein